MVALPPIPIMKWYVRHRQDWIAEMLSIYGFINREHLIRKFEISVPQASADLNLFLRRHPDAMAYNRGTKRYEALQVR